MSLKYLSGVTTLKLNPDKCTGCGMCVNVCPHAVFIIKTRKAAITDPDLCMECGACALNCSFEAITVKKGVGCAQAVRNGFLRGTEPDCGCGGDSSCC
ncbi:MAG: ferredoxin [Elusimicrobia bacterium CG_4_10_14_0_2_um_filter_56_8]|nr:MAG: ferredoxin [Elusimicrobia bacterium CG1_02_56_21]PJA13419.1 MAG: ferredoxin [Elusimicrobia bacterium CG_4_10_14_0_2_um_filter_56_8]